jgi:hypothetical protein
MYTARCTSKVLQALHLPASKQDQPASTALGDWYVNFIHTRNHRMVHFVSDRSLLSVVVPVKTLKTVLDRHITSLRDLLEDLGVNPAIVQAEIHEMRQRHVAKTRSRSVLASMRDLALTARWILERTPGISSLELTRELSQVPCGPLEMAFPAEAAIGLLLELHARPAGGERGA